MRTYRTKDKDTLDRIAWKHYGVTSGAVEVILEANRGLADFGPILPSGLLIKLPECQQPVVNNGIKLWD